MSPPPYTYPPYPPPLHLPPLSPHPPTPPLTPLHLPPPLNLASPYLFLCMTYASTSCQVFPLGTATGLHTEPEVVLCAGTRRCHVTPIHKTPGTSQPLFCPFSGNLMPRGLYLMQLSAVCFAHKKQTTKSARDARRRRWLPLVWGLSVRERSSQRSASIKAGSEVYRFY